IKRAPALLLECGINPSLFAFNLILNYHMVEYPWCGKHCRDGLSPHSIYQDRSCGNSQPPKQPNQQKRLILAVTIPPADNRFRRGEFFTQPKATDILAVRLDRGRELGRRGFPPQHPSFGVTNREMVFSDLDRRRETEEQSHMFREQPRLTFHCIGPLEDIPR